MNEIRQKLSAFGRLFRLYFQPVGPATWDELLRALRERFPGVRQLSTADLASWLDDPTRRAPRLLDVRHATEFAISHLPGAQPAHNVAAVRALGLKEDEPIVVYCSAGYRSAALGAKLTAAGFRQVFNLEGSLFQWANEGRPVFRGATRLDPPVVHPYSRKWGGLLRPALRA